MKCCFFLSENSMYWGRQGERKHVVLSNLAVLYIIKCKLTYEVVFKVFFPPVLQVMEWKRNLTIKVLQNLQRWVLWCCTGATWCPQPPSHPVKDWMTGQCSSPLQKHDIQVFIYARAQVFCFPLLWKQNKQNLWNTIFDHSIKRL